MKTEELLHAIAYLLSDMGTCLPGDAKGNLPDIIRELKEAPLVDSEMQRVAIKTLELIEAILSSDEFDRSIPVATSLLWLLYDGIYKGNVSTIEQNPNYTQSMNCLGISEENDQPTTVRAETSAKKRRPDCYEVAKRQGYSPDLALTLLEQALHLHSIMCQPQTGPYPVKIEDVPLAYPNDLEWPAWCYDVLPEGSRLERHIYANGREIVKLVTDRGLVLFAREIRTGS